MPGSEFRLLPRLPLEFKVYKVISPGKLGVALTRGWTPVASVNFEHTENEKDPARLTRFLIGKGVKRKARKVRETPVLMFPQPPEPEPRPTVDALITELANMTCEEVLAFHQEIRVLRGLPKVSESAESKEVEPPAAEEVTEAMNELLGDDGGDTSDGN